MKKSKNTGRALFSSILAVLVCCTMLVGTTFAWFTDSDSAAVNTIKSGTLDVELLAADGTTSLTGQTLEFKNHAGSADILWEPGASYDLPSFIIGNNGNLALVYKLTVKGIVGGDAKLLEAIDFTVTVGAAAPVVLSQLTGHLAAKTNGVHTLSGLITITGTMKAAAGNEYQNLTLSGIAITVVATQDTVEVDKTDNQYDADAVDTLEDIQPIVVGAPVTGSDMTITAANPENAANPLLTVTVPEDAVDAGATAVTVIVKDTGAAPSFSYDSTTQGYQAYDVTMTGATPSTDNLVKVKQLVGIGLTNFKLYHNSTLMTAVDSEALVDADQEYYYDSTTGYVTFLTSSFSPFTLVYDRVVASITANGVSTYYPTLKAATDVASAGSVVELIDDFANSVPDVAPVTTVSDTTINLGDYTYSIDIPDATGATVNWLGLKVKSGTTVINADDGGITTSPNGELYSVVVGGNPVGDVGHLVINGGNFISGCTSVQVTRGTVIINGGFFKAVAAEDADYTANPVYLINCIDANYNSGAAKVFIRGGTFVNFNPADNAAETGGHTNFVDEGYHVTSELKDNGETWYTVVPDTH